MSGLLTLNSKEMFWERQFSVSPTLPQTIFDVVFGILMPIICFYLDPGIVRGNFFTLFSNIGVFIYSFSLVTILTLAGWLGLGHRVNASAAIFGGILLSGAVCSFIIAIIILPLTIIGLFLVIGVLGLVPFITGFVYLRNALRAIHRGNSLFNRPRVIAAVIISVLFAIGIPAFAQWEVIRIVSQSMNEILSEDSGSAETAVHRIRTFRAMVETDRIVWRYEQETNQERKERLAKAYKDITGEEIEARLTVLKD